MGTIYLTKCMLRKCLQRKRGLPIVLLGLFIAALGILIVASVARNRELQSPWYMQRSATILFENPASPKELYSSLHDAFHEGSVNGYALIADIDVSGGISLGGLEGDLWNPVDSEDGRFSTHENIFWIHQQAVPEAYFYDLGALKATVNGIGLDCAGLTYYGLNWDWSQNTVLENCLAPCIFAGKKRSQAKREAAKVLKMLGITGLANREVKKLSGGQKQRVAIARAIINRPNLILADEPTGALDSRNADMILQALLSLVNEKSIVILATHDTAAASRCGHILRIKDGRIVQDP